MHITCNKCNTTFKFPISKLSQFTSHKKVQCSKCKNIWVINPKDFHSIDSNGNNGTEQENNSNTGTQHTTNLMLCSKNRVEHVSTRDDGTHDNVQCVSVNISKLQIILLLVLIPLAALLFMLTIKYNMATQEISCPSKRHLLLSEVDTSYDPKTKTQIITYRISNKSNISVQLPDIQINTFDHSGALVNSHIFNNKRISFAPNASTLLTTRFTNEGSNLHSFSINIGNNLSFYLDDLLCKYYTHIKSLLRKIRIS